MRIGIIVAAAALINEILAVFSTKWGFQRAKIDKAGPALAEVVSLEG
jgi:hypothetical protein